jgi:hypothetical protein
MIKSFLVKPKEIYSIEVRRHSTDSCCLDPLTTKQIIFTDFTFSGFPFGSFFSLLFKKKCS